MPGHAPIVSIQRIFQPLVARGGARETRRGAPASLIQEKIVRRKRREVRLSSSLQASPFRESVLCDRGLQNPAEDFIDSLFAAALLSPVA
jgi:hypothetical protein